MGNVQRWLFAPHSSRADTFWIILCAHYLLLGEWKTALFVALLGGMFSAAFEPETVPCQRMK